MSRMSEIYDEVKTISKEIENFDSTKLNAFKARQYYKNKKIELSALLEEANNIVDRSDDISKIKKVIIKAHKNIIIDLIKKMTEMEVFS